MFMYCEQVYNSKFKHFYSVTVREIIKEKMSGYTSNETMMMNIDNLNETLMVIYTKKHTLHMRNANLPSATRYLTDEDNQVQVTLSQNG